MDLTEKLLENTVTELYGKSDVVYGANKIDFRRSFPRIPILEAIKNKQE